MRFDVKLRDIMTHDVVTVSEHEKLVNIAKMMAQKNIGSIILTDNGNPVGILTEKDFTEKVVAEGANPTLLIGKDIMTADMITADPDMSVFDAHQLILHHRFRRLPIVQNSKLIGIVTETDLLKAMGSYQKNINPVSEQPKKSVKSPFKGVELKDSYSYIITEDKADKVFDLFVSEISKGLPGLCLTRTNPQRVKEKYGLKKTMVIWLSELGHDEALKPNELEKLVFTIKGFVHNAPDTIVMLDGIEYLINYTSFKEVFHVMQSLIDYIATTKANLLISVNPKTMDSKEFELLQRNLEVIKI